MISALPRLVGALLIGATFTASTASTPAAVTSWLMTSGQVGMLAAAPAGGGTVCYYDGVTGDLIRIWPPNVHSSTGQVQTIAAYHMLQVLGVDPLTGGEAWSDLRLFGPEFYPTIESGEFVNPNLYYEVVPTPGTYRVIVAVAWPTGYGMTIAHHDWWTLGGLDAVALGSGDHCPYA